MLHDTFASEKLRISCPFLQRAQYVMAFTVGKMTSASLSPY